MAWHDFTPGEVLQDTVMDALPQSVFVRKASDESVTSSTVLQNDDELVLPVLASTRYFLHGFIKYDGAAAGDIAIGWTGPAGYDIDWISNAITNAATGGVDVVSRTLQGPANTPSAGALGSGTNAVIPLKGIVDIGATAGNLQLQWAQAVSNATATRVRAGSVLRLTKLVA